MKRQHGYALAAVGLMAVGAGLMFFLDPKSGSRRRAMVRDRTVHGYRATTESLRRTGDDLANRARGVAAFVARPFRPAELPDDDVLLARIKSRLGHVIGDPQAIELKVDHGAITVAGKLAYRDARKVLKSLASTPGVATVENHLAVETAH